MSTDDFSLRDRLLLAFADAASHGVAARPAVDSACNLASLNVMRFRRPEGEAPGAALAAELRARHPGGLGSFVFWTWRDDARFDGDGELTAELPLHCSGEEVVAAGCARPARAKAST